MHNELVLVVVEMHTEFALIFCNCALALLHLLLYYVALLHLLLHFVVSLYVSLHYVALL